MVTRHLLRPALEILGFVAAVLAFNVFWYHDPGFQDVGGWPYFIVPVVFAAMYGWSGALGAWAATLVALAFEAWLTGAIDPGFLIPGALAGLYLTGGALYARWVFLEQSRHFRSRFRELVVRNSRLSRENRVMEELCRELEVRISRNQRSVTALVTRLGSLERGSFHEALEELLAILRVFVGVEKASFWRFDAAQDRLVLEATLGWSENEASPTVLTPDRSIPGWVYRNAQSFSLRMASDQPHFRKLDEVLSLMAYPVRVGDQVWGVLNVEALPFVKYSRHAESILDVVFRLASRSLKTISDRELLFARQETDDGTGLPGAAVLVRVLDEAVRHAVLHRGSFSLVLMELSPSADFEGPQGRALRARVLTELAKLIQQESSGSVDVFRYKGESQLAFYLADRDADGTALFCLGLLGAIQGRSWRIDEREVRPEVLLGYGALRPGMSHSEDLLDQAERLLAMQRVGE